MNRFFVLICFTLAVTASRADSTPACPPAQGVAVQVLGSGGPIADLLVMHMVIPEGAAEAAKKLHAEPSRIGQIASAAGADRLLLSHFMARSLQELDTNVSAVAVKYDGDLLIAADLLCIPVD